jgi:hypothetical protein
MPAWEGDSKMETKNIAFPCTSFWRLRIPRFHSVLPSRLKRSTNGAQESSDSSGPFGFAETILQLGSNNHVMELIGRASGAGGKPCLGGLRVPSLTGIERAESQFASVQLGLTGAFYVESVPPIEHHAPRKAGAVTRRRLRPFFTLTRPCPATLVSRPNSAPTG